MDGGGNDVRAYGVADTMSKKKTIGEKLSSLVRRKSPWIMHIGGSGCLPYDSEVIIGNQIVKVGDFVNSFGGETRVRYEGFVESMVVEGKISSFSDFRPCQGDLYAIHRLKSPGKILEIKTTSGVPVRLTPDHKVMVDRIGGPEWIKAKDLKKRDFLFCPRKIDVSGNVPDLIDTLSGHLVCHIDLKMLHWIKGKILKKYGTMDRASAKTGVPKIRFSDKDRMFNLNELRYVVREVGEEWEQVKKTIHKVSTRGFEFNINKKITENLLYLIGLIASDGHITMAGKSYKVAFSNKNEKLMKLFVKHCRGFLTGIKILDDNATGSNTPIKYVYSSILADVLKFFGIEPGKCDFKPVFSLPESYISSFIAGYFDGDGHISFYGKSKSRIEMGITTSDRMIAKRIFILLKRVGIASKIISSRNESSFGVKTMNRVSISTHHDIQKFLKSIPFKHPKKVSRAKKMEKMLSERKHDMSTLSYSSLSCNRIIKEKRSSLGMRQVDVYDASIMSNMENGTRLQKNTITNINSSLGNTDQKHHDIDEINNFDYYLDPVSKIDVLESRDDIVYNFSVKGIESYVPEGMFTVKNCNGCSIEILASLTPKYDVERFGVVCKGSPRHADVLVVEGPVNKKMAARLKRIYNQMPRPKYVLAVGACTVKGGVFQGCYNVDAPLDKHIPVDIYVPGCPPKPEAIINGLVQILNKM
jgi:membrane-bound hydrogenase subunit mbhJ